MANENDRFTLRTDDHLGGGDIAFEGNRRILDDSDAVVVLQEAVNALPAGAVHETAVYEDDCGLGSILRICAHGFLLGRGDRERGYSASPPLCAAYPTREPGAYPKPHELPRIL